MPNEGHDRERSGMIGLLKSFWTWLRRDWAWKLACLVLAIFLWGGLITQDTSMVRTKSFNDVTISVVNADALLRSGYIVVSGLETEKLSGVRMRVDVPQRMYEQAAASNYNVRVDLSRIRAAGTQTLQVLTTSSTTYGSVTDLSVSTIEVEVEEYVTRSRIPVRIETTGSAPEGFYAAAASADPIYVEIAGPKSLTESVVRCVAHYDMSALAAQAGTERTAVPFSLQDRQEQEIAQDNMTVSPINSGVNIDSITIEQNLYPMRALPVDVSAVCSGTPKKGYHIASVTAEPSSVKVAYSELVDDQTMDKIYPSGTADVTDLTETTVFPLSLSRGSDLKYISATSVYVTVVIEPDEPEAGEAP